MEGGRISTPDAKTELKVAKILSLIALVLGTRYC